MTIGTGYDAKWQDIWKERGENNKTDGKNIEKDDQTVRVRKRSNSLCMVVCDVHDTLIEGIRVYIFNMKLNFNFGKCDLNDWMIDSVVGA